MSTNDMARLGHVRCRRVGLPSPAALALAACALVVTSREGVEASTSSAPLVVAAAVNTRCSIAATPINFGTYTGGDLDVSSGIVVNCSPGGRRAQMGLSQGTYPAVGSTPFAPLRRMQGPTAGVDFLGYQLYQDAARTQVWSENGIFGPGAPQAYPKTWTVHGRVPAAQVANPGMYTDTVLVILDF